MASCLGTATFAQTPSTPSTERIRYAWHLRGGLAWIASLRFPTSGRGELRTVRTPEQPIDTTLRVTADDDSGYYLYQSQINAQNGMTLMTLDGYAFGQKSKQARTVFDYEKRVARTHEQSPEKVKDRVRPLAQGDVRDVLTTIWYLRQNASTITQTRGSSIYSNGKLYPVVFEPLGAERLQIGTAAYSTRVFKVSASAGTKKKWPGAVKVWLTADAAAIPVRIEIARNLATLRLDYEGM